MLKNKKGITLIALVVTIVVLLILAGVSISLVLDNNGIIGKSKDARLETRASQVEDEIGLWKQSNFIKKESNQAQESADTVLASLISRKLLTEDEIDREQELITIKKKDGSIVKEISYGSVTINISKTPATEKASAVLLQVDSVIGITIPNIDMSNGEEELNNFVNSLSEEEKKEAIRKVYINGININDLNANCKTFQDALDWAEKREIISEATEDAFWTTMLNIGGLDKNLIEMLEEVCYNKSTEIIEGYTVTNPDNENSNTYMVTANGTYTFKVQDMLTGKIYTKEVEVTNIEESETVYEVGYVKCEGVILINKENDMPTTFEKAYIVYDNKQIEVTSRIERKMTDNNENYDIVKQGIGFEDYPNKSEIKGNEFLYMIVKDNKLYIGMVEYVWPE